MRTASEAREPRSSFVWLRQNDLSLRCDHEYTTANARLGSSPSSRPNVQDVYCEVVQVGACKFDLNARIGLDVLIDTVRAHELTHLPSWLVNMTGMTEQTREKDGISIPSAMLKLQDFCVGAEDIFTYSEDWYVPKGSRQKQEIPFSWAENPFTRVKPLLEEEYNFTLVDYIKSGFNEKCSSGRSTVLGLTLSSTDGVGLHNAAHDARSLVHSIAKL